MYIFAVMLIFGTAEFMRDLGDKMNEDNKDELLAMYGGMYRTMVALFMSISGGEDWKNFMTPLVTMHAAYGPLFIAYIFFMHFGVLNVVVGAFVAKTSDIAAQDQEAVIRDQLSQVD